MNLIPKTVSARAIQRNYRKIFEQAKFSKEPIIVLTNNTPDVAILDIGELEKLYDKAERMEVSDALGAINKYKEEKRAKKLKRLTSLKKLS